eukprot:gnl/TRDRNA2_/TRDRNA2_182786_c0_seq1.p1 gnl/TRDRNA2_/TRDRNA2_182786_c0~~gnl/TRDRNA2_/TRDRNA2_182786_c0_seq1.p1  ORF type:complete len:186 (+),score=21.93 gnl/TRDRNA2_/TRDRNA2_182786_c0_seq1:187-744(+)
MSYGLRLINNTYVSDGSRADALVMLNQEYRHGKQKPFPFTSPYEPGMCGKPKRIVGPKAQTFANINKMVQGARPEKGSLQPMMKKARSETALLPMVATRLGTETTSMSRTVACVSGGAHGAWSQAPGSKPTIDTNPNPISLEPKKKPYFHPAAGPGDWRTDASCDYVGWTTAESWADAARIGGKI